MGHITSSGTVLNGKPELNGLCDMKMGPVDKAGKCATDGAGLLECPGYFGHIELAKPMFHIGFFSTVLKVLRCVSYEGSKLMIAKVRSGVNVGFADFPSGFVGVPDDVEAAVYLSFSNTASKSSLNELMLLVHLMPEDVTESWAC